MRLQNILHFSFLTLTILSCNQSTNKEKNKEIKQNENVEIPKTKKSNFALNEKISTKHSDSCGCSAQFDLKDSLKLVHIKNQFYKSKTGHLYEKTKAQKETGNSNDVKFVEYFNGYFSQEVDPLTFEELTGWFAKDKNYVYYYRPTFGGMQISKIDNADSKTFKILKGHYKYAMDKKHFFDETEIIENFEPNKTKLYYDKYGKATKMMTNKKEYIFEP